MFFLILGGVVYAGIWYWQNQQVAQEVVPTLTPRADVTADWKTYTNTQYGFEFKYPKDWSVFEDLPYIFIADTTISSGTSTCKTKEDILTNYYLCSKITISTHYFQSPSILDHLKSDGWNQKDVDNNTIKVGLLDLVRVNDSYILYGPTTHKGTEVINNFNTDLSRQILSTFKFTK